ncbi:MAG: RNA 2'-phosphotransferase [Tabrizicola sp.]|jgi:putative RNA 2'-phosphotransferase|nr:RNA 2'-phosphotransferase [Tabrizicola sp.]
MKTDKDISRFLSLVLRHEPGKIGIVLDNQGWVAIDTLLSALPFPLERPALEKLVRESDKQRFAISSDGAMIRANQGHSVSVDLGLAASDPPEVLYHGTVEKFLPSILAEGLVKGSRHHVHLSANIETAQKVGDRRGSAIILVVAAQQMVADGHRFFVSDNGVWLTEHVPAPYLTRLPPSA